MSYLINHYPEEIDRLDGLPEDSRVPQLCPCARQHESAEREQDDLAYLRLLEQEAQAYSLGERP